MTQGENEGHEAAIAVAEDGRRAGGGANGGSHPVGDVGQRRAAGSRTAETRQIRQEHLEVALETIRKRPATAGIGEQGVEQPDRLTLATPIELHLGHRLGHLRSPLSLSLRYAPF